MKNLLNYQTSEYDCGPVSILNGIRYLFEREEIYPDIVKFIMLYCMDTYNEHGELCKRGTSAAAVHYMSNWLNHFSETRNFPIHCDYIQKRRSRDRTWHRDLEHPQKRRCRCPAPQPGLLHYVLLTGLDGEDRVLLFDPYYEEIDDPELDDEYKTEEIEFLHHMPSAQPLDFRLPAEPHRTRLLSDGRVFKPRGTHHVPHQSGVSEAYRRLARFW